VTQRFLLIPKGPLWRFWHITVAQFVERVAWSDMAMWVRRVICRRRGHAWKMDTSTPENFFSCTRCMVNYDDAEASQ